MSMRLVSCLVAFTLFLAGCAPKSGSPCARAWLLENGKKVEAGSDMGVSRAVLLKDQRSGMAPLEVTWVPEDWKPPYTPHRLAPNVLYYESNHYVVRDFGANGWGPGDSQYVPNGRGTAPDLPYAPTDPYINAQILEAINKALSEVGCGPLKG